MALPILDCYEVVGSELSRTCEKTQDMETYGVTIFHLLRELSANLGKIVEWSYFGVALRLRSDSYKVRLLSSRRYTN